MGHGLRASADLQLPQAELGHCTRYPLFPQMLAFPLSLSAIYGWHTDGIVRPISRVVCALGLTAWDSLLGGDDTPLVDAFCVAVFWMALTLACTCYVMYLCYIETASIEAPIKVAARCPLRLKSGAFAHDDVPGIFCPPSPAPQYAALLVIYHLLSAHCVQHIPRVRVPRDVAAHEVDLLFRPSHRVVSHRPHSPRPLPRSPHHRYNLECMCVCLWLHTTVGWPWTGRVDFGTVMAN